MPIGLGVSLGVGGGKPATSGGTPPSGSSFSNTWSADFAEGDEYFTMASTLDPGEDCTFSAWLYPTDLSSGSCIIGHSGTVSYFYIWSTRQVGLGGTGQTTYGTFTNTLVTLDDWNHVVFTKGGTDGRDIVGYINGSETESMTWGIYTNPYPPFNQIGKYSSSTTNNWNGNMDEIAVWNGTTLSAAQVTSVWNGGAPGDLDAITGLASPTHWWRMGENNSPSAGVGISAVTDMGTGGNNLTQSTAANQPVASTSVP